jgi:hypothetical protein
MPEFASVENKKAPEIRGFRQQNSGIFEQTAEPEITPTRLSMTEPGI